MPSLPQDGVIQGSSPLELNTELPYHCTMKRKVRKKKKKGIITANVAGTKFEIVRLVIDEMGFIKTPDEDETSNLIWCDAAVQQEKITDLQNYQVRTGDEADEADDADDAASVRGRDYTTHSLR